MHYFIIKLKLFNHNTTQHNATQLNATQLNTTRLNSTQISSTQHIFITPGVVHSDEVTEREKGKVVMKEAERAALVSHIKHVDLVLRDCPWVVTADYIAKHKVRVPHITTASHIITTTKHNHNTSQHNTTQQNTKHKTQHNTSHHNTSLSPDNPNLSLLRYVLCCVVM